MSALIEKVQQFAVLESCGCWRWTGAKQARGQTPCMQWQGKVGNVRRHILEDRGVNMKGYLAWTSCGNQDCVNPDHVVRTTRKAASAASAAAMDATACTLRAMRTAYAIRASKKSVKLSMEIAEAIRADDRPQRTIAAEYGVSQHTVHAIKKNIMWRDYTAAQNPFSQLMR